MQLNNLLKILNDICPFDTQETWDHSGLQIGNGNKEINRILVGFDVTDALIEEAIKKKVDLIITHHPFFFKGLYEVNGDTVKGRQLMTLIQQDIALVACHTCWDKSFPGVNSVIGDMLGLGNMRPLAEDGDSCGLGVIGNLTREITAKELCKKLREALKLPVIRMAGNPGAIISRVGILGGAGMDFAAEAYKQGADAYITSDCKYHEGQWAVEQNKVLIDISHFSIESPSMTLFSTILKEKSGLEDIYVSENLADFWITY